MDNSDWDKLGKALKSLLSKYNLDLSNVGKGQRLDYKDFEKIFYHLFLMIDASEVRRKFWSVFPARNRDEESRFIHNAVSFINDRHLNVQKVSATQLRMCGGGPFRRLVALLIERAAESEIASIEKRIGPVTASLDGLNLAQLHDHRDILRAKVQVQRDKLERKLDEFSEQQETLAGLMREKLVLWRKLNPGEEEPELKVDAIKRIYKSLLDRLEASNSRSRKAVQQIMELPMSMETPTGVESPEQVTSKRVSIMVKEMREYFSPPKFTPDLDKSRLVAEITQKLDNYDKGMKDLVSEWRAEQERDDEALLEDPEMRARYEFFEKLIPLISLPPIGVRSNDNNNHMANE